MADKMTPAHFVFSRRSIPGGHDAPSIIREFPLAFPKSRFGAKTRPRWTDPDAWMGDCTPYPKQKAFLDRVEEFVKKYGVARVGFGGSPGPGKTMALAMLCLRMSLRHPGYESLVIRHLREDLVRSTLPKFIFLLEQISAKTGLNYRHVKSDYVIKIFNGPKGALGSVIWFVEGRDPNKIQGAECDGLFIDEAVQLARASYGQLQQRHRGSIRNPSKIPNSDPATHWPLVEAWASNPGMTGWARDVYIMPMQRGQLKPPYDFIEAHWTDNPSNPPDYADRIRKADPGAHTEALLSGSWGDIPDSVYGSVFSRADHVREFDPQEVTGLPVTSIQWVGGYDWGKVHKSCIFVGFIHDSKLYIYDEYVARAGDIQDQAYWMQQYNHVGAEWYADRAVTFQVRDGVDSKIIDEFDDYGIQLIPANEGGQKFSQSKGVLSVSRAFHRNRIVIHPQCEKLIEAIELFQHVRDRVSGVLNLHSYGAEGKDECDALRYLVINKVDEMGLDDGEDEKELDRDMSPMRRSYIERLGKREAVKQGFHVHTRDTRASGVTNHNIHAVRRHAGTGGVYRRKRGK